MDGTKWGSFTNLHAGKWMLEKLGHKVVLARDGQEALDMLQANELDVVFMDVQMPVLNGVEATQIIRSWKNTKAQIPIIALTGYSMSGDQEKFLKAGMDGYLAKPVHVQELEKVLEQIFSVS